MSHTIQTRTCLPKSGSPIGSDTSISHIASQPFSSGQTHASFFTESRLRRKKHGDNMIYELFGHAIQISRAHHPTHNQHPCCTNEVHSRILAARLRYMAPLSVQPEVNVHFPHTFDINATQSRHTQSLTHNRQSFLADQRQTLLFFTDLTAIIHKAIHTQFLKQIRPPCCTNHFRTFCHADLIAMLYKDTDLTAMLCNNTDLTAMLYKELNLTAMQCNNTGLTAVLYKQTLQTRFETNLTATPHRLSEMRFILHKSDSHATRIRHTPSYQNQTAMRIASDERVPEQ